jgi:hypothetical protein
MLVDDLDLQARIVDIDGAGGILGQAGYYTIQPDERLPTTGLMEFDLADALRLLDQGLWDEVVLHEMAHTLGFGTVWEDAGQNLLLEDAATPTGLVFTGAEATQVYLDSYTDDELISHGWTGRAEVNGVPVEQDGSPGTARGHWDEEIFGDDLMTGFLNGAPGILTDLTIASLADIGYDMGGSSTQSVASLGQTSPQFSFNALDETRITTTTWEGLVDHGFEIA